MSDATDPHNTSSNSPPAPMQRRRGSSLAGQTFNDLFQAARSRQASDSMQSTTSAPSNFPPASISSAFQAHRRRLSLTTVGLASSPNNQPSPFAGFGAHRDSTTSTSTTSIDEMAVEDDVGQSASAYQFGSGSSQQSGSTPFGRRMSFGARAMRDVKAGPAAGRQMNGTASLSRSPIQPHGFPAPSEHPGRPSFSGRGDSMAWVDSFVTRGDRRASITFPPSMPTSGSFKTRARSAVDPQQTPTVPTMPAARVVPDGYGERILRGDVDF